MPKYKTEPAYLVSGLAIFVYAVYALFAGSVLTFQLEFVTREDSALDFYVHTIGLVLVGAGLAYRSLLFIPGNREYHAMPDRSQDGPYEVDPVRTARWAVIGALIFLVFLFFYGWLRP